MMRMKYFAVRQFLSEKKWQMHEKGQGRLKNNHFCVMLHHFLTLKIQLFSDNL